MPNFAAPELLIKRLPHTQKVDIWGVGVILYSLLIGKPPFEGKTVKETYECIYKLNYSFPPERKTSQNARDLVEKILKMDPNKRPSIEEILGHPFLDKGSRITKHIDISKVKFHNNKRTLNKNEIEHLNWELLNFSDEEIYVIDKIILVQKNYGFLLNNKQVILFMNDQSILISTHRLPYFAYQRKNSEKKELLIYDKQIYPREHHQKVLILKQLFVSFKLAEEQNEEVKFKNVTYKGPRDDLKHIFVEYLKNDVQAMMIILNNGVLQLIQEKQELIIFMGCMKIKFICGDQQETIKLDPSNKGQFKKIVKSFKVKRDFIEVINNHLKKQKPM